MKIFVAILFAGLLALSGCTSSPQAGTVQDVEQTRLADGEYAMDGAQSNGTAGAMEDGPADAVMAQENQEKMITRSEMAKHNVESDCYVGYGGKVYDATLFVPKHPGGADKIVPWCGTQEEFTRAFEGKHGKSKVEALMEQAPLLGTLSD